MGFYIGFTDKMKAGILEDSFIEITMMTVSYVDS